MKSIKNIGNCLTRGTCLMAVAGLAFLAHSAVAQEKGGERLMKLLSLDTGADGQKLETGTAIVMSCPKCKDTAVKVVQPMGKGGRQETASLRRHECPGCSTKMVTEGAGKQAKSMMKHTCKQGGGEGAVGCVIKKGSSPTKGVEHSDHSH